MTELVEILNGAGDTIFTIQFKTQADPAKVVEKLKTMKLKEIKDDEAEIRKLSRSLVEGETVTVVGHLADGSQQLGRTLVIDVEAGYKQVDHRTIQFIILKNVKYTLGRKSPSSSQVQEAAQEDGTAKWDGSKLAIGNWFSEIQYYKYKGMCNKEYEFTHLNEKPEQYLISGDHVKLMNSSQ